MASKTTKLTHIPLHWAAFRGDRAAVADLLTQDKDVNAIDKDKETPLFYAARKGQDEIVIDLLAAGANAGVKNTTGMMALHLAAFSDAPVSILALAKSGIDINDEDENGNTAIHVAAMMGHPAAIRTLVKSDANINCTNARGWTALHQAAWHGRYSAVHALIDSDIKLNAKDEYGNTATHKAARQGHGDVVSALITAQAKIHMPNDKNETPLFWAQRQGHTTIADMLIGADKSINAVKLSEGDDTAKCVFDGVWQNIVMIRSPGGQGSGVIIAPNIVATNWHVAKHGEPSVYKAREIGMNTFPEKTKERGIDINVSYRAKILNADQEHDFCLLEVENLGGEKIQVRASSDLRVGEDVYAIGNPRGEHLALSTGVISQLRDKFGLRQIQTTAAISAGSSGGGLFDRKGNLVGITTSSKIDAENLNFAIPADLIFGYSAIIEKNQNNSTSDGEQ